jgi:hypothetical protein
MNVLWIQIGTWIVIAFIVGVDIGYELGKMSGIRLMNKIHKHITYEIESRMKK